MQINDAFIAQTLSNKQSPLFLCDWALTVVSVGERAAAAPFSLTPGTVLPEAFPSCGSAVTDALEQLQNGASFAVARFEIFFAQTAMFMLPLAGQEEDSLILCCMDLPELSSETMQPWDALSIVSDRYRTPVFHLLNNLDALALSLQEADDYQGLQRLNAAAEECYDILRTVQNIRDYAGLFNQTVRTHFVYQDLCAWLDRLCQGMQSILRGPRQFRILLPDEPIVTRFDEKLLALALFHLTANACAFSPEESAVTIRLTCRSDTAQITITDEGDGIHREDLARVFEPLYTQRDMPMPEERMGTGLGLPIAKKVAELHGGQLLLTSEPYKGTTVSLTLPIREPEEGDPILFQSEINRYVTDRFSPLQIIFHRLADLKRY